MQCSESKPNAFYYFRPSREERRLTAGKALYGWLKPGDLPEPAALWLKNAVEDGRAGEFVQGFLGFQESRRSINWGAVAGNLWWTDLYARFERYRAAVRAQKSKYYRRRLSKLGIDWKAVQRPFGTELIDND